MGVVGITLGATIQLTRQTALPSCGFDGDEHNSTEAIAFHELAIIFVKTGLSPGIGYNQIKPV